MFIDPSGRQVIQGYVTDIITDLSIDFLKNRPKDKPFFLMCHHKAPHRSWEPDEKHRRCSPASRFPSRTTLWDDYATRTDAIRECRQKVFYDLTRRDLKLQPPAGLKGPARNQWLNVKPTEVEIEVNGQAEDAHRRGVEAWKYQRYLQDYLACVQSIDDNVGRLLDLLDKNGLSGQHGRHLHQRPGLFPRRPRALRQAVHVRRVDPNALLRPLAGGNQAGRDAGGDGHEPRFRADLHGDGRARRCPPTCRAAACVPLLKGQRPADWRTSWYYRYYHDPGDHNTRAHYGVRTETHKLIYFWKKDQWECTTW